MANNKLTNSLRNSIAAEGKKSDITQQTPGTSPTTTVAVKPTVAGSPPPTTKVKRIAKKPTTTKRVMAKQVVTKTQNKSSAKTTNATPKAAPNPTTAKIETPKNFTPVVTHKKLHQIIETHYNLCETYLENLEKVNDNLHNYFNQLVEINNLNALIKLNLSYISATPTRLQEMIAQNKNIFSDFFEFVKPEKK